MFSQPQELEVWYLLPAIRKELAAELKELGLTQRAVAQKLHVTEAAISQYLKQKRANKVDITDAFRLEIKHSAKRIKEQDKNIIEEIQKLSNIAKEKKLLCQIHHDDGFETKGCDICFNK